MITRKEVAELAGVSPATVSNVINGSKYVSSDLVLKVERAVEELCYVPNRAARSLASRRTDQVGILVRSLSNPYFGVVAEGMEDVARRNGYVVSLITTDGQADQYISRIIERQMDGVFLTDFDFRFTEEQFEHMCSRGVHFVLGKGSVHAQDTNALLPCSRISIDYSCAVQDLFVHLKELGHSRVAFLSGNDPDVQEVRKSEYMRCVRDLGFHDDPALIIPGDSPHNTLAQDGYRDMKRLLSQRRDFTAVFTLNDLMAMGAMKAIRDEGLRIPEDLSVIGCDDIYLSETTFPALTTIRIPKFQIGRLAMELLLELFQGGTYRSVEVKASFVARDSVARRG